MTCIFQMSIVTCFDFCGDNNYQCLNGYQCIAKSSRCDYQFDCHDMSDEYDCPLTTYTWCDFEQSCLGDICCGWKMLGNSGRKFTDGKFQISKTTTQILAKKCKILIKLENDNTLHDVGFYAGKPGNLRLLSTGNFRSNIKVFQIETFYQSENTEIIINGTFLSGSVEILSVKFIDCTPVELPFEDYPLGKFWFNSTRFVLPYSIDFLKQDNNIRASYINHNYNKHAVGFISEIRSEVIAKSEDSDQACLYFDYTIKGEKNYLLVTTIDMDTGIEENEFSTNKDNYESSGISTIKVFFSRKANIDLGIISSAIDGIVYIKNIHVKLCT